jgi:predicted DCC family thiol-disulfide oxidoreductase YuxK
MQKTQNMSQSGITVYYDGLCQLCSREIEHYKKMDGACDILFVDITAAGFDAKAEELDPHKIHQSLHVRDADGQIHTGVDAFIMIWSQLNSLKRIVPLASFGPVKKTLEAGYFLFAKVRPLLPRKNCSDSPYCEVKFDQKS